MHEVTTGPGSRPYWQRPDHCSRSGSLLPRPIVPGIRAYHSPEEYLTHHRPAMIGGAQPAPMKNQEYDVSPTRSSDRIPLRRGIHRLKATPEPTLVPARKRPEGMTSAEVTSAAATSAESDRPGQPWPMTAWRIQPIVSSTTAAPSGSLCVSWRRPGYTRRVTFDIPSRIEDAATGTIGSSAP